MRRVLGIFSLMEVSSTSIYKARKIGTNFWVLLRERWDRSIGARLRSGILKSLLLFVASTLLIQVFYTVMTGLNLYADGRYFPYGYLVHITYYVSILLVTFLFVGEIDFVAVGLKFVSRWKRCFLVGSFFALVFHLVRIVVVQGTFSRVFYLPLELHIPTYILLGLIIGLAEESAFRGYILRNFLDEYKP